MQMNEAMLGTWVATSDVIKELELLADGGCRVDGTPARWQATGQEIWLLDAKTRVGTKWRFEFEDETTLVFSDPEDFKYVGGTEYVYFQLIDPGTAIRFSRQGRGNEE